MLLKQSTATTLKMGPFVDSTDGATAETGLTIAQADIQISKAGAAFAQTSEATPTTTHDADGWYPIPLTATDTGTLGSITVQVTMAGALPVWREHQVVPANVYDSLVAGSDTLQSDLTQVNGAAQTATLDTIKAETAAIVADTNELQTDNIPGTLATIAAYIDTEVAAILEDTGTTLPASIAEIKAETALIVADTGTDGVVVAAASKSGYSLAANQSGVTVGTVNAVPAVTLANGAHGGAAATMQLGGAGGLTSTVTGNLTGSAGSVTGAVGSVTGAVGSVTGAVGSVTGAVGSVTGLTASDVGAIKTITDAIGATGTGLSAVPWNAAWDAEVQSEVNDALVAMDCSDTATLADGTLGDRIRKTKWAVANKMEVTEADGTVVLYKDDGTTAADVGTPAIDSAAGTTTRDALYGTT